MAYGPITSWQIEGEKVEAVTDFLFLDSKITVDGDCSHEVRRQLLLSRKASLSSNPDSVLKSKDITLLTRECIIKAMVFPVVMSRCKNRTIKKAEHWSIDAFKLWCWKVPWIARRSNQSILKEINTEYSLKGLVLKLQLQYFGHLMWTADSLEKTSCLEKWKAEGEEGSREWDSWMASLIQWTWTWANSGRWWRTGKACILQSMGSRRDRHDLATEQQGHKLPVIRISYEDLMYTMVMIVNTMASYPW